jgi:hypothetical protein
MAVTGRGGRVGGTFVTPSRPGSITKNVIIKNGTGRQFRGGSTWVAFGGHTAGQNAPFAGMQAVTTVHSHPVWDHRIDHLWNGHRYHWVNNAWYIADTGEYPYAPITQADQNPLYDEPAAMAGTGGAFNSQIPTTEAAVQSALEDAGYYTGAIDGTLNQGTVQAIAHFQRDHGVPPTGQVDDALLSVLFSR